jgi:hypothetical protein
MKGNETMRRGYLIAFFLFAYLISGVARVADPPTVLSSEKFKFPDITGWKQSGEIQTFVPKTLFEYINGAADLYIMYDFQELKSAEYVNEKKASVIIDVYRHKTPTHAFGIYSQERLPKANFMNIGTQGYVEEEILNFIAGPYYVKITGYKIESGAQEVLISFAKKVLENLGEIGTLPTLLNSFPQDGKVKNSEKFIAKNFLGYSFLHSAFTSDYELSGTKFKLFIIENDPKECKNIIQKYLEQTGKTERGVVEGRHLILDPHHGEIDLYWQGRHIWGTLSLTNPDLRSKYLKLVKKGLQKRK